MNHRTINITSVILEGIVADDDSSVDSCLHIKIDNPFGACIMLERVLLNVNVELMIQHRYQGLDLIRGLGSIIRVLFCARR